MQLRLRVRSGAAATAQSVVVNITKMGFSGWFDFVHVPRVYSSGDSVGYAVVNFTTAQVAKKAMDRLSHATWLDSPLTCEWHDKLQGLEELVARFSKESYIEATPIEYRPVLAKLVLEPVGAQQETSDSLQDSQLSHRQAVILREVLRHRHGTRRILEECDRLLA